MPWSRMIAGRPADASPVSSTCSRNPLTATNRSRCTGWARTTPTVTRNAATNNSGRIADIMYDAQHSRLLNREVLRMWTQVYAPIGGSLELSAIAAAVPIVVLFIMLGALRTQAWVAASAALLSAFIVAIAIYRMPLNLAVISMLYGGAYGLFPIAWI